MPNTPKYQFEIDAAIALARAGMQTNSKGKDVALACIERLMIDKFTPSAEGVYWGFINLLEKSFGFKCRRVNKFVEELRCELEDACDDFDLQTLGNN